MFFLLPLTVAAADVPRTFPDALPGQLLLVLAHDATPERFVADPLTQQVRRQYPFRDLVPLHPALHKTSLESFIHSLQTRFPTRSRRALDADFSSAPRMIRSYRLVFEASDVPLAPIASRLRQSSTVEAIEPNQYLRVNETPNDPFFSTSGTWGQGYDDLWNLKQLGLETAWEKEQGKGVTVAVIDTGVDYTHPDIAENIFRNTAEIAGQPNIDDDGNGVVDDLNGIGYNDFGGVTHDPMDHWGHGTHVAGTIAAEGNNQIGVIGVAPQATILPIGTGSLTPTLDGVVQGLMYATLTGADIASMSIGSPGFVVLQDAIQFAANAGVFMVAAAGNEGADMATSFPAAYPQVLSVGANGPMDRVVSLSNWGWQLDVVAPGGEELFKPSGWEGKKWHGGGWNILSLRASEISDYYPGKYYIPPKYLRLGGTSMSTPHVAGVAALLIAHAPQAPLDQIRQAIRHGANDIESGERYKEEIVMLPKGWDVRSGYGRVDAMAAMSAIEKSCVGEIRSPHPNTLLWQRTISPLEFWVGPGTLSTVQHVSYQLEYGKGVAPTQWKSLMSGKLPAGGGAAPGEMKKQTLVVANIEGPYTIRLTVKAGESICATDRTSFHASQRKWNAVLQGNVTDQAFGEAIGAADVNGDGTPELFISATRGYFGIAQLESQTKPQASIYVVSGLAGISGTKSLANLPVVEIRGETTSTGQTLAVGGDIDGDQIPDLVVGDPYFKCPEDITCGKVSLVRGADVLAALAAPAAEPVSLSALAGDSWIGGAQFLYLGFAPQWIGDLDGDARSDLAFATSDLASATSDYTVSNIFVVLSSKLGPAQTNRPLSTTLKACDNKACTDHFTFSSAGYDATSTPRLFVKPLQALHYQASNLPFVKDWEYTPPYFPFAGFGTQIVGSCDLDGDAEYDLIVQSGAPETFVFGDYPSITTLFASAAMKTPPIAPTAILMGIPASTNKNLWAPVVACAEDYDNDGFDDLAELYSFMSREGGNLKQALFLTRGTANLIYDEGGPFVHASTFWLGPAPTQPQWAPPTLITTDLNQDGLQDLAVSFATAPGFVAIAYGSKGLADSGIIGLVGGNCIADGTKGIYQENGSCKKKPKLDWEKIWKPLKIWPFFY